MEGDALSAGAVSRRLGVAVTTLRTWHQRYGLGPSGHARGAHRRYNQADIRRLEAMHRLTTQGVPAAHAARIAHNIAGSAIADLTAEASHARTGPTRPSASQPAHVDDVADGGAAYDPRSLTADHAARPGRTRAGGGHAIPVGRAGPAARGLAQAAMRLDASTIYDTVQRTINETGVTSSWDRLLVPVLIGVGARHAATNDLVAVEHLLSGCISNVLGAVPRPSDTPRVLLACADEEQHSLPLEALAAALAERGIASRMLGARTPSTALISALTRSGPMAVMIWSQTTDTGSPSQLDAVLNQPGRPAVLAAAGPGWPSTLPAGVVAPNTLAHAVALFSAISDATK